MKLIIAMCLCLMACGGSSFSPAEESQEDAGKVTMTGDPTPTPDAGSPTTEASVTPPTPEASAPMVEASAPEAAMPEAGDPPDHEAGMVVEASAPDTGPSLPPGYMAGECVVAEGLTPDPTQCGTGINAYCCNASVNGVAAYFCTTINSCR